MKWALSIVLCDKSQEFANKFPPKLKIVFPIGMKFGQKISSHNSDTEQYNKQ